MNTKGLSQEGLKGIACITMLIDHIGATLVLQQCRENPQLWDMYHIMRIIGRMAFPIYCFLLVEGVHHTRNVRKYGLRLIIAALLSEIPFDLALSGRIDWTSTSVMITLLLGFWMIRAMDLANGLGKLVVILPFFLAAEFLRTDYGGNGIAIIAMLELTRGLKQERFARLLGSVALLWFGGNVSVGPLQIPIELFGLVYLLPVSCYRGRKLTHNRWVQWAFYLFYPVHLMILFLLQQI